MYGNRKETDWIWSHMRSELKSYSSLVDNKKSVNNFKISIDGLTSGTNSMYKIYIIYYSCRHEK